MPIMCSMHILLHLNNMKLNLEEIFKKGGGSIPGEKEGKILHSS